MSQLSLESPPLPQGWPTVLEGPLVGCDSTLSVPDDSRVFKIIFQPNDILEVEHAVDNFKGLGLHGDHVGRHNFLLSNSFQERLRLAAIEIHSGTGICILRGLDPTKYSDEDNLLGFLGLASFIGEKRGVQDRKGNVISHITAAKTWNVPDHLRHGIHTSQSLSWHTDMGVDILSLQVRQCALQGGSTYIASAWQIYNELVASYPTTLQTLVEAAWPIQVSGDKSEYILAPLLDYHKGKLMISLDPGRLGVHPVTAASRRQEDCQIPSLTTAQEEALDVVSRLASKYRLRIDAQPGDLLFVNNWALLHARDCYIDDNTTNARRHLVRLWIRNSELGWLVPESMRIPWEAAFGWDDEEYAIRCTSDLKSPAGGRRVLQRKYPIMPTAEYKPPKYTAGSAAFVLEDSDEES